MGKSQALTHHLQLGRRVSALSVGWALQTLWRYREKAGGDLAFKPISVDVTPKPNCKKTSEDGPLLRCVKNARGFPGLAFCREIRYKH